MYFDKKGKLEALKREYKHDEMRELKKGTFLCGDSSSRTFCINVRQICDLSSGKPSCACAEGYTGRRCQDLIREPEPKPPSGMPTFSPTVFALGRSCTQQSDCATLNSECTEGECKCKPGFERRKGQCKDIDECKDYKDNKCDKNAECINTEGTYECRCKDGYDNANSTIPGRQCQQINECKLGIHNCETNSQVCIDLRPPEKWRCVERTPEPSPKPTPKPTPPGPCSAERISMCMNTEQVYGLEKIGSVVVEPTNPQSWPDGFPKDISTLIDDTGTEYYLPGSVTDVDIKFDLLQKQAINGVYIQTWFVTTIGSISIGLVSDSGVTTWINGGSATTLNEEKIITFSAVAVRYLQIRLTGGTACGGDWGLRSVKVSGKCANCLWYIGCWNDMCGCPCQ
jgi:Calcium-binding EGF domain/EB module